jgi:hypothetical protein
LNLLIGGLLAKRIKLILFFPILIIIFMLGWALYVAGDKRERSSIEPLEQKRGRNLGEYYKDSEIEMGLIEEVMEDNIGD